MKDCDAEAGNPQRQLQKELGATDEKLPQLYNLASSSPGLSKSCSPRGRHVKGIFLLCSYTLDLGPDLGNIYMKSADKKLLQEYMITES